MSNQVKRTRPKARDPPVSFVWITHQMNRNGGYEMQNINRCFIIEDGVYIEVPAERVLDHGVYREEFKNRYFFPFDDILLEMSKKDRRYFYACQEAMKDIIKQPKKNVKRENKILVVSIDELVEDSGDGNQHLDFLEDRDSNVADQVEHKILLESIKKYWNRLKPSEQKLLTEYYQDGNTERVLAVKYGVDQRTINKRRRKILDKLLKSLENKK